jgi:hypothetical protein
MKPTIVLTRGLATALVLATVLAVTVQASPPPEREAERVEISLLEAPARVEAIIPVQGRLTDASGNPVADGDYNLTLRVYDGSGVLCTDGPLAVHTEKGLFNTTLDGCSPGIFDGRPLWLTVQVGGDAEMTPSSTLRPVPYAMSLRPGAIVANYEAGHALTLNSTGVGGSSSALWAENTSVTGGIALWAVAAGDDATLISSNSSTGPLFKGFGGDGGEDEFRIDNDGSLQVKPDTELFFPGALGRLTSGGGSITLLYMPDGRANLYSTGAADGVVQISLPVPSVLYGQPIEIETVTIGCQTNSLPTNTTAVKLWKQDASGTPSKIVDLAFGICGTSSGSWYAYSPPSNNMLDASTGALSLELDVHFESAVTNMLVTWVKLTLDTHDLY